MSQATYWLEAREPLMFRDGRPNNGRSEPTTLPFPFPGTMAGLVRTRLGSSETGGFELHDQLAALRQVGVRGPVMLKLAATGSAPLPAQMLVPAPRDCLFVGESDTAVRHHALKRLPLPAGCALDDEGGVELVGLGTRVPDKPSRRAPLWWPWPAFQAWLERCALSDVEQAMLLRDGAGALPQETRVHVKLGEAETAEEGMLFSTTGLRPCLVSGEGGVGEKGSLTDLGLLIEVTSVPNALAGRTLRVGPAPCGGERRLAIWQRAVGFHWPAAPKAVLDAGAAGGASVVVRVILLTPALFDAGWRPGTGTGQLLGTRASVKVTLVAARVTRPETVSGWDFETARPKATRRVVPAGCVYWLELEGAPADRQRWLQEVWMSNVSDQAQDRSDGYGLAVVGVGS